MILVVYIAHIRGLSDILWLVNLDLSAVSIGIKLVRFVCLFFNNERILCDYLIEIGL